MDGKDSKEDALKQLPPTPMDGKDDAGDSDSPPDDNNRFYFLDKSDDISELTALHHKFDGKAEYTKWRTWNFAQEINNKKKDKLIEQMAARLREIEEKLQKIQNPAQNDVNVSAD